MRRRNRDLWCSLLVVALAAEVGSSQTVPGQRREFTGVVEQVIDGETICVRDKNDKLHKVLINWIDVPEPGQKWSRESRETLKEDTLGKQVRVVVYREEPLLPSDVYLGDTFLSEKRLKDGWAWHYKRYSKHKNLSDAEASARKGSLGMWKDADIEAPWDYRERTKKAAITWDKFVADCGRKAQAANEAKSAAVFRQDYRGRIVTWTGVVEGVKEAPIFDGYYVHVSMKPTESLIGGSDLMLSVPASFDDQVLKLKQGDRIRFSGRLEKQGGLILDHSIELDRIEAQP